MKPASRFLAAGILFAALSSFASAQLTYAVDFEGVPPGSLANNFATSHLSFHEAHLVPFMNEKGEPISGSDHWAVDELNDALFPVTVENPLAYDRGHAPSGETALQALWQPVLIAFDRSYRLANFAVTLDNDSYGFPGHIAFVTSTHTVAELLTDQTVPGYRAQLSSVDEVRGIVLPSGAFYDDLRVTLVPVPEPSAYGMLAGLALFGIAAWKRAFFRSGKRPSGF